MVKSFPITKLSIKKNLISEIIYKEIKPRHLGKNTDNKRNTEKAFSRF